MRKIKPVIILLSIQLAIALTLALINPVSDFIVRKKGTEYIFALEESYLTGDFVNYIQVNAYIKLIFEFDRFESHSQDYALISTDENGISYISSLSDEKPENGNWLGSKAKTFDYYYLLTSDKIDYELIENSFISQDLFYEFEFSDKYEITAKAYVYNGKIVLDSFLVDGVELKEFLRAKKDD